MAKKAKKAQRAPRAASKKPNPLTSATAPPPEPSVDPFRGIAPPASWSPAREVFERTMAVPTIFPDFNLKVGCGGLPLKRITLVHGPTHGGKSAFVLGLILSFLRAHQVGAYVDAEHAVGSEFIQMLFAEMGQHNAFFAKRPKSYEDTIKATDEMLQFGQKRVAKDPNAAQIIVVDSINKLTPKGELKKVSKATGADGDELAKGHQGRDRARLNQAWLDYLVPKIGDSNCALTLIAQERDSKSAGKKGGFIADWQKEIKGGAGLKYDSSLICRVSKGSRILMKPSENSSPIVGFRHTIRIWKSRVGQMDGRYTDCHFHLSNGRLSPAGFDVARDMLLVAEELGIVTRKAGSAWYTWRKRRWNGVSQAVVALSKNPDHLRELTAEVNEAIRMGDA